MTQVKVKGSAKLFNSRFLEILTRTHPMLILSMYVPLCAFMVWYFYAFVHPSFALTALMFLSGIFTWTFCEYILHRYVFHWVAESGIVRRMVYLVHGVHHEYPKDKGRLVLPPLPSIFIASLFFILFRTLLGEFVYAFFSGFVTGYLCYAMIHYTMHIIRPPKNAARFLWVYHNLHHYKYPDKAFGVSSPLWDYVFRTLPPAEDIRMKRKSM